LPFRFGFTFAMVEDKDVFDLSHARLIFDVRRTRGVGQVQRPQSRCFDVMIEKGRIQVDRARDPARIRRVFPIPCPVTTMNGKERKWREKRNRSYATTTTLGMFIQTTFSEEGGDASTSFQTNGRYQFFDQQTAGSFRCPPPVLWLDLLSRSHPSAKSTVGTRRHAVAHGGKYETTCDLWLIPG
jgi:hypothetical protein